MKRLAFSGSILIVLLLLDSCAKNPVTGKTEFMLMSKEQEIAMGQQSDPEIVAFFGIYQDEQLQRFIDQKGEAMAAISHRPDLPFEFKIVDSPVVNAFAVPGGFVYFTRGIMAHFNNEAEFAGVLGHEIGHITARHSAKQYSNAMLGQLGLVAGTIISPEFAQFADIAQQGLQLLFLKFGRDAESAIPGERTYCFQQNPVSDLRHRPAHRSFVGNSHGRPPGLDHRPSVSTTQQV